MLKVHENLCRGRGQLSDKFCQASLGRKTRKGSVQIAEALRVHIRWLTLAVGERVQAATDKDGNVRGGLVEAPKACGMGACEGVG